MIGNHQYGVTDGHGSSLLAPTGGESAVLRGEVSVPRTTSGMRRFHQGRPQPGIALGGLATSAFASTLVITRTHSSPGGQLPIGGEATHISSNLRQYRLRRTPPHSRNRIQTLNCFFERAHPLGNLRTQLLDGLLEKVDVCQLLWAMRKRWCAPKHPLRARSNCAIFARSFPTASWAIAEVSVEPSIRAFSICRADLPMMSVATEASFMLAPSSAFCSLLTSAERSCTRVVR